jgi:hypothetical protein
MNCYISVGRLLRYMPKRGRKAITSGTKAFSFFDMPFDIRRFRQNRDCQNSGFAVLGLLRGHFQTSCHAFHESVLRFKADIGQALLTNLDL